MVKWFFENINLNYFTLYIDSRYGKQEDAKKGYNPNKRGRNTEPKKVILF